MAQNSLQSKGTSAILYLVPGLLFIFFAIPLVGIYLLIKKKEPSRLLIFIITVVGSVAGTIMYGMVINK